MIFRRQSRKSETSKNVHKGKKEYDNHDLRLRDNYTCQMGIVPIKNSKCFGVHGVP